MEDKHQNRHEVSEEAQEQRKRIRFVKKILRHMPRKASLHRYPVLNKFADVARKRSYLWSFRVEDVIPAFYTGWLITFIPIPSVVQICVAFFIALVCRANVMILVCLQLLSNAVTCVFMVPFAYKTGDLVVKILGKHAVSLGTEVGTKGAIYYSEKVVHLFATTTLGAVILGVIFGTISTLIYRYFAQKYSKKRTQ